MLLQTHLAANHIAEHWGKIVTLRAPGHPAQVAVCATLASPLGCSTRSKVNSSRSRS